MGALAERCGATPFSLNANDIWRRAEQTAGFSFHDPLMRAGIENLVNSVETQAKLSTFGRFAIRSTLQRSADSRFKVERAIAEGNLHMEDNIQAPVFIIGMPRTGTTILHVLLHLDRNHRAPRSWECLLPYPAPHADSCENNERIDTVRRDFEQLFRLVPDFRTKHYMTAESPQECIGITALNFASFQYIAQAYVPDYHDWFVNADQEKNLRWHRRFLNFLQSGEVRKPRWLLKSPVHLMRLRPLFNVYPDATIIMTHRHPSRVVPSVASLVSSARSLYSDQEDTMRTGREQCKIWADYFTRFLDDRRELGREDQIIDVLFDDFANDQMAVVDSIYARFDWNLHPEDRVHMATFIRDERQGKHGPHDYNLEQIGITSAEIDQEYSHYLDFIASIT